MEILYESWCWLVTNRQWVFGGFGVAVITIPAGLLWKYWKRRHSSDHDLEALVQTGELGNFEMIDSQFDTNRPLLKSGRTGRVVLKKSSYKTSVKK